MVMKIQEGGDEITWVRHDSKLGSSGKFIDKSRFNRASDSGCCEWWRTIGLDCLKMTYHSGMFRYHHVYYATSGQKAYASKADR